MSFFLAGVKASECRQARRQPDDERLTAANDSLAVPPVVMYRKASKRLVGRKWMNTTDCRRSHEPAPNAAERGHSRNMREKGIL